MPSTGSKYPFPFLWTVLTIDPVRYTRYGAPPRCKERLFTVAACLNRNAYREDKCQAQIDALYECCNAFYQQRGDEGKTPSCPKANLLRLKMKQRAEARDS